MLGQCDVWVSSRLPRQVKAVAIEKSSVLALPPGGQVFPIAALGTFEKDRASRPIYQTENGLHIYSLHSNTTTNEGETGSMAVEDSVLQRTPDGETNNSFFQPVEGKVWHWCGQSTGGGRLARAAVESGSWRKPPSRGLRRGYQWATTSTNWNNPEVPDSD